MTDQPTDTAAIKALVKAQMAMPKAIKDSTNPHFNKRYESLAAVQAASLPHLHANGFAVLSPTGQDESGPYLETILMHESGESFRCRIPLIVDKQNMQGFKSAVTYARRIGLGCLSGVAPEDDDGNNAAANPPKRGNGAGRNDTPPEGTTPFDDDPDYDPVEVADRMLDGLKHTADGDLGGWSKANKGNLTQLRKSSHAEFTRVLDECIDRKARIRKEDTE